MDAIVALPDDKTVLMIAHRLSTVRRCERILVLDWSHIDIQGRWDDLIISSQVFKTLVSNMKNV